MGVRAAEQLLQAAGDGDEPGLGDDQLARQIHQVVEPVAVDADRLGDLAPSRSAGRFCGRRVPRVGPDRCRRERGPGRDSGPESAVHPLRHRLDLACRVAQFSGRGRDGIRPFGPAARRAARVRVSAVVPASGTAGWPARIGSRPLPRRRPGRAARLGRIPRPGKR